MLKRTLLHCSVLCFLNTVSLYADTCDPSKYACANIAINGNIAPDMPIVYTFGWGSWGDTTVDFGSFIDTNSLPSPRPYLITFGTLNINPTSIIYINTTSHNPINDDGNYVLKDGNGDTIPYSVTYTACKGSTQPISPPYPLPAIFPQSEIEMAGPNPACQPESPQSFPGNGAGQLTFSLIAPSSDSDTFFAAGSYTDTLNIVVCTQGPCTN